MLNFKDLPCDGRAFELLIRELIFSLGYKVIWSGNGADGGRDLVCIEEFQGIFKTIQRSWLIQCKHKAHSGNSVGVGDLDDILTSCRQHQCDGYILATSTAPSSAVVSRLEAIECPAENFYTGYWDAVVIERLLKTSRTWHIAQRFFKQDVDNWSIFATDRPNHWTANYKGEYFQITLRVGSNCNANLDEISKKIDVDLGKAELPPYHFLKLRSAYYDDKHGTYLWYIDYMLPYNEEPRFTSVELRQLIDDEWNQHYDFRLVEYSSGSDHYDPNHYDYYDNYMGQFILGIPRPKERNFSFYRD